MNACVSQGQAPHGWSCQKIDVIVWTDYNGFNLSEIEIKATCGSPVEYNIGENFRELNINAEAQQTEKSRKASA